MMEDSKGSSPFRKSTKTKVKGKKNHHGQEDDLYNSMIIP